MVIILALFVSVSLINVEQAHFTPFFDGGISGLLGATVMVLISYGGVTKVAAVAEEIENPGRNLPLGLLLSLIVTTLLYALIVFVLVGLIEGDTLAGSNIPMVDAVEPYFGVIGIVLIVVAAMLALISTANAGILTASRYPFALSRDKLIPEFFARVSKRFHTPVVAILITGGAMLVIILTLPVEEIAKTAGAFQIVVYILVNIALIAFRVKNPDWYKPEFKSPLYPWMQIFGIVSGMIVLGLMDTLPLIGGVGIVILGTIWYFVYGRKHVKREGVISKMITEKIISEPAEKPYRIVVPIANPVNQRHLLRIAAASASAYEESEIIVVSVIVVPDQTSLAHAAEFEKERIERHNALIDEANSAAKDLDLGIRTKVIIGRDVSRIVINLVKQEHADEVILGWKGKRKRRDFILGSIIDPIVKESPSKVMLVKQMGESLGSIACFVGAGPHAKAAVKRSADLFKSEIDTHITFINIQPADQKYTEEQLKQKGNELISRTLNEAGIEKIDYQTKVIISENIEKDLIETAQHYETTCIGATRSSWLERALFGSFPELIGEKVQATVLIVRDEERSFYSVWHIFKRFFNRP
jgi:basic amino acid/polyamine antiporter, APA family